jgi:glycosyltransferase involved in cell wall biosynthesis
MDLKISIITTSYNQVGFLQKNLDSIAAQTYHDYEHIIIDPGSNDGSRGLIEKYAESNKNVVKIFEPDSGQVEAINKGMAMSTGKVLTWLNSDDYYDNPNVLADVNKRFHKDKQLSVLYGRGLRVDHNGDKLSEAFIHPNKTDFKETLKSSIGILQPSLFYKRRVYEQLGGLDDKYNLQLDYEYWIRIAKANFRFGKADEIFSRATVHQDAKSTGQRKEQLNECLYLMQEQFGFVHDSWLQRYAEFYSTGEDRKVSKNIEKDKITKEIESAVYKGLRSYVAKK